jgi:hypothetical protein
MMPAFFLSWRGSLGVLKRACPPSIVGTVYFEEEVFFVVLVP